MDDALGEALDKAARLLGLCTSFSGGGAAVEAAAAGAGGAGTGGGGTIRLTVPLLRQRNCDFSYSGLKNGFRMAVMKAREEVLGDSSSDSGNAPAGPHEPVLDTVTLPAGVTAELCAAFQEAAFQHAEDR